MMEAAVQGAGRLKRLACPLLFFESNHMEIILLAILNILCPPAAVAIHRGLNEDFIINLVLTILGYFPGLIHGFYVLLRD